MASNPFRFFISGVKEEVLPGSDLWELPLSGRDSNNSSDNLFTTGSYYSAACKFLSKDNFAVLNAGIKSSLKPQLFSTLNSLPDFQAPPGKSGHDFSPSADKAKSIEIFLEKHGAFYHPFKIKVIFYNNQTCCFVLNGAVSNQGTAFIKNEYKTLLNFSQMTLKPYLPRVYGFDFIKKNGVKIGFFIGEWFKDYKEFHISDDKGRHQISIWDSDGSCSYIEMRDAFEIYQQIAEILTYYYNIETFEQISLWHHAAGDFILNRDGDQTDVRLITIRKYAPLTQLGAGEKNQKTYILPSLLLFFLDMTVKIRLDRINGTGELALLDTFVIDAAVNGLLTALEEKTANYKFGDLRSAFIEFFLQFNLEQISDIVKKSLENNHSDPLEIILIKKNLKNHCQTVYSIFKNL